MSRSIAVKDTSHVDEQQEAFSRTLLGFWVYILTDCVLFGCLFATYVVLHNNTFGGPSSADLFSLDFALKETLILLVSSFTCALATLCMRRGQKSRMLCWFAVTFLLGISFLSMELSEFASFISDGHGYQKSAFLSAFFTLVGTHGAHISVGLLWIAVMSWQVCYQGLTLAVVRRLRCLGLFWHFLDVVWIFIFTVVYLMGVV